MAGTLKDRIALITGASRGIGQAVAVRYAAEGAHVILVARDKAGLEETDDAVKAAGGTATLVQTDLSDAANIEALAGQVSQRFSKLDILVGNAGMLGDLTPIAHLEPEVWDKVMNINLTANFQLIRCFDLLLKAAEQPRALFVTSGAAEPLAYWSAYGISKAALENMVYRYAAENENTHFKINIVSPGQVRTRMNAQAFPGADPMQRPEAKDITEVFVTLASSNCAHHGECLRAQ